MGDSLERASSKAPDSNRGLSSEAGEVQEEISEARLDALHDFFRMIGTHNVGETFTVADYARHQFEINRTTTALSPGDFPGAEETDQRFEHYRNAQEDLPALVQEGILEEVEEAGVIAYRLAEKGRTEVRKRR